MSTGVVPYRVNVLRVRPSSEETPPPSARATVRMPAAGRADARSTWPRQRARNQASAPWPRKPLDEKENVHG